jgi:hypothetical protein
MRLPIIWPVIFWLVGFLPVMALGGRGKLSLLMGLGSVGYVFSLPFYLLLAIIFNFSFFRGTVAAGRINSCVNLAERSSSQLSICSSLQRSINHRWPCLESSEPYEKSLHDHGSDRLRRNLLFSYLRHSSTCT